MTKFARYAMGAAVVAALAMQPATAQQRKPAATPNAAAPAAAATGNVIKGLAILNLEAAVVNSDAYRYAVQQQQTTYKTQIDQAKQRSTSYEAQRKTMVDKVQADAAAKRPDAELQTQVNAIQKLDQQTEQDLNQIVQPVALSDAYVKEQIGAQLDRAIQNAMTKNGITLVLNPNSVMFGPRYDMTGAVVAELNVLLPSSRIQVIPPQGWVPREARQQQGATAQPRPATPSVPAAATPPKPAGPQPEGR